MRKPTKLMYSLTGLCCRSHRHSLFVHSIEMVFMESLIFKTVATQGTTRREVVRTGCACLCEFNKRRARVGDVTRPSANIGSPRRAQLITIPVLPYDSVSWR